MRPVPGSEQSLFLSALIAGSITLSSLLGELILETYLGRQNDANLVVVASLGTALVSALTAAVLRLVVSARFAVFAGALIPGALLAHHAVRTKLLLGNAAGVTTLTLVGALLFASTAAIASGVRLLRIALVVLVVAIVAATSLELEMPRRRGSTSTQHGAPSRDVILIVMDTTRRDHLPMYGYSKRTTPSLEQFAATSQVYENAWSVSPWTPASHASMFTGLLPAEHGADGQASPPLSQGLITIQELLQGHGFRTAAFVANPLLWVDGWDQGFDDYVTPVFIGVHTLVRVLNRLTYRQDDGWILPQSTPLLLTRARRWWVAHPDQHRFVFINLLDPHRPYCPPAAMYAQFGGTTDMADALAVDQDPVTYHLRPGISQQDRDSLTALYDGELASMDRELGLFFDWLSDRDELDSTLIVVTADHGERLGERGLVGHDLVVDSYLLRVPLLIRLPDVVPPAGVSQNVQLNGLPGYIAQVLGINAPSAMRSRSISRERRDYVVAQYQNPAWFISRLLAREPFALVDRYQGDWQLVSDGRFALVASPANPASSRLVDTEVDVEWQRDASNEYPDVARRLSEIAETLPTYRPVVARGIDSETATRLRELGYVD